MYGSKNTSETTRTGDTRSTRKGAEGGGTDRYALPQTGVKYTKICLHGHRDCDLH